MDDGIDTYCDNLVKIIQLGNRKIKVLFLNFFIDII